MSEQQLLESFSSALGEADSESTFACGGHIPIVLDSATASGSTKSDIESGFRSSHRDQARHNTLRSTWSRSDSEASNRHN
jgi:hypothetical protein